MYLSDLKKLRPSTAKSWAGGGSYSKWEVKAFELSGESTVSYHDSLDLYERQHHRVWIGPAILTDSKHRHPLVTQASSCSSYRPQPARGSIPGEAPLITLKNEGPPRPK